jgi:hypothetical protein
LRGNGKIERIWRLATFGPEQLFNRYFDDNYFRYNPETGRIEVGAS